MSQTIANLSNILKEYYLGPVVEQLNNEVLLLSRLESRSEDLVGKRAYVPLHTGRTSGIGARGELQTLPTAGKQAYDKAVYDLKYLYGRVQVSGPSMAKTKNEAGAFLQALKSELDGVRNDLKKDLARQVYGAGNGVIGGVADIAAASGGAQVITLDSSEPIRKGHFYVGMVVDVLTTATSNTLASNGGGLPITAVDVATPSITVTNVGGALATTSETDFVITRAGARTASGYPNGDSDTGPLSNEIDGIQRIVPSDAAANFGGITTTAGSFWDNIRVDPASGAASNPDDISLEILQKAMNQVRIAGGMPSVMLTTLGIQRDFYMLLQDQVRYTEPTTFRAGFSTLEYAGMPMIADIDAPFGRLYLLDETNLKVFSDQDFHFLDMDGQTLRQVSNLDAYEAIMVRYMNLGATRRNTQAVIGDSTSPITVGGSADIGV
jgi:hypothetical protein